jgi:hypothetical protein
MAYHCTSGDILGNDENDFIFYYEKLALSHRAICTAVGVKPATLKKWLLSREHQVPLVACCALKMLWFMKNTHPNTFCDWLIIQDYGVDGDLALDKYNLNFLKTLSKRRSREITEAINASASLKNN